MPSPPNCRALHFLSDPTSPAASIWLTVCASSPNASIRAWAPRGFSRAAFREPHVNTHPVRLSCALPERLGCTVAGTSNDPDDDQTNRPTRPARSAQRPASGPLPQPRADESLSEPPTHGPL